MQSPPPTSHPAGTGADNLNVGHITRNTALNVGHMNVCGILNRLSDVQDLLKEHSLHVLGWYSPQLR